MTAASVVKESTAVMTIRLPKSLEKSLQRESRARGVSSNSFITSLLFKFDTWDRLADKFGMITLPNDVLSSLLQGLEENKIEKIARQCGASVPRAIMDFWFSQVTPETFLEYLALRTTYMRFVRTVVTEVDNNLVLTGRHQFGRKWSLWSCYFLAEAIKTNFGVDAKFEINANSYRIEWPKLVESKANGLAPVSSSGESEKTY